MRGWGTPAEPDPVLYEVRGFDPATRSFRYAANPRFGDTRPTRTLARAPFRLTLDFNINLGPSVEGQQLGRTLRSGGAGKPAVRLSVDSIREQYSRTVPDIYDMILMERDSLFLSPEQAQALRAEQGRYRVRVDSVWAGLARYLAALPERHDRAEALRRQEEATDRAWEAGRQEGAATRAILSPLQQAMLPELVSMLSNSNEKIRVREVRH